LISCPNGSGIGLLMSPAIQAGRRRAVFMRLKQVGTERWMV
jgi:hypothetical protein